jgi:hypothetical protein
MRLALLVTMMPAPGLRAIVVFVVVVEGVGSGAAPDWKYEQPVTASAARRSRERII